MHVVNAGIFGAVQQSGLFSVDPDVGVGKSCERRDKSNLLKTIVIDNPNALSKYYRLLLFITRLLACLVVSHGSRNAMTMDLCRTFVADNRALIVATLKRQARLGGVSFDDAGVDIEELVELFIFLIWKVDYLEVSLTALYGKEKKLTISTTSWSRRRALHAGSESSFDARPSLWVTILFRWICGG